jgi:excisionase family DNA binding protein
MDEEIKWFGSTDAARMLGIALRTLYRLIDDGQIRAFRFGRVIRVREADIEAFLAAAKITPGTLGHLFPSEGTDGDADEFLAFYDDASNGSAHDVHRAE